MHRVLTQVPKRPLSCARGAPRSFAVEREFVGLMQEHTALVRVDLRHGTGHKGHKLGLIRLRSPTMTPPQVWRVSQIVLCR